MQLQKGKRYKDREGRVYLCIDILRTSLDYDDNYLMIQSPDTEFAEKCYYFPDGKYFFGEDNRYDIIKELENGN